MKKRLLLVDGNALLYRAFFAFPPLTAPAGEPIGAVYGFTRILLKTIKNLKPDAVTVSFDLKGPTFRHDAYAEYKGTRQKMPEELSGQIKRTHQIVDYLSIPICTLERFEADDVIGTIAATVSATEKDYEVVILTGDQDLLQLVTPSVSAYMPTKAGQPPMMYDVAGVKEKYGFRPDQLIDYKGLRGDSSDNIPGVSGVGEVTAKKLIAEYGNLEAIYTALDNQPDDFKPALRAKLAADRETAFLSRDLATIRTNAPISFDLQKAALTLETPRQLVKLFEELGFKSLINDLPQAQKLVSTAADVFGADPADEEETPLSPSNPSLALDHELEPVLRAMEEYGVAIDLPYLKSLETEFQKRIAAIKEQLFDLAGEPFNPDSPQQIATVFYEHLHIPTDGIRKGKNGYTTDAATLQKLAEEYPIASVLLAYREITKLLSTYVLPLQELADENSRIHTSFAATTATGRLSSKNPNLQNIPVKTEEGRRIRQAFVAPEGSYLIAADYSQIELRVAAHLSEDPEMIAAFQNGRDFHHETAQRMGVDRRTAKIINFSILYGKGPFGFAMDLGITVAEAKTYIEQYFKTYKGLRAYLDEILRSTQETGYAETLFGRRRPFPEMVSGNFHQKEAAKREALNFPIQGTAAEIIKMAMCQLPPALKAAGLSSRLILSVHDELVLEATAAEATKTAQITRSIMNEIVKLRVPLEVTAKQGKNWNDLMTVEL